MRSPGKACDNGESGRPWHIDCTFVTAPTDPALTISSTAGGSTTATTTGGGGGDANGRTTTPRQNDYGTNLVGTGTGGAKPPTRSSSSAGGAALWGLMLLGLAAWRRNRSLSIKSAARRLMV